MRSDTSEPRIFVTNWYNMTQHYVWYVYYPFLLAFFKKSNSYLYDINIPLIGILVNISFQMRMFCNKAISILHRRIGTELNPDWHCSSVVYRRIAHGLVYTVIRQSSGRKDRLGYNLRVQRRVNIVFLYSVDPTYVIENIYFVTVSNGYREI